MFCCGGAKTNGKKGWFEDEADEEERLHIHSFKREQQILRHNLIKKREPVICDPIDVDNFQPKMFPKSTEEREFIDEALGDNFIFSHLSKGERNLLIDAMQKSRYRKGAVIIKEGEVGDYFYVLREGKVNIVAEGESVGMCEIGDSFGELALLYNSPRAATCVAVTACVVWKVDQSTFRQMMAKQSQNQEKDLCQIITSIPLFQHIQEKDLCRFTDALTQVRFVDGERIVSKGEIGNVFYIIEEGMVKCHDIGLGDSQFVDQILKVGDFFGERSLLTGEPRAANVTALSDCTCLCLSRDTFETVFGSLQDILDAGMKKRFLKSVPIFANSNFSEHEMDALAGLITEQCFGRGFNLSKAGSPYRQDLWIIRSGRVVVTNKNGKIFTLKTGDYFGDKSVKGDPSHISSHTAILEENTTCWVLTRKDIEGVIGDIHRLGEYVPFMPSKVNKSIRMKDLDFHRILGQGGFGKVYLVTTKKGDNPYALKKLDKRLLIKARQIYGVRREKEIMYSVEHPFLLQLISSFQDEDSLYLLLELIQGGELFQLIHVDNNGLPQDSARFYGACVISALGHFHQRSIVYRDLKPENVMINTSGYCTVVDFGFAKVVVDKTYTLCGTPEYLAPEIIMSKGHDKAVDYWAFGVLIFEMLTGESTFYIKGTDQISLFKRIVMVKYNLPDKLDADAKDLVQKLLVRRQSNRLGNQARGHRDIQDHPWFKSINTKKLERQEITAPWIPEIKNPLDSSHFRRIASEREPKFRKALTKTEQDFFTDF